MLCRNITLRPHSPIRGNGLGHSAYCNLMNHAPDVANENNAVPSTILVVEDEVLIRFVIADYLRDCGFQVVEAANADEAVKLLETDKIGADIVFSDIQMPGSIDGMGLARWIRTHFPTIKVVLTSGNVRTAELAEDLCHLQPIEQKPYNHEALLSRLQTLLAS